MFGHDKTDTVCGNLTSTFLIVLKLPHPDSRERPKALPCASFSIECRERERENLKSAVQSAVKLTYRDSEDKNQTVNASLNVKHNRKYIFFEA